VTPLSGIVVLPFGGEFVLQCAPKLVAVAGIEPVLNLMRVQCAITILRNTNICQ